MLENIFSGLLCILGIMILVIIIVGLAIEVVRETIKEIKKTRGN